LLLNELIQAFSYLHQPNYMHGNIEERELSADIHAGLG
jgi:hypothetical protein